MPLVPDKSVCDECGSSAVIHLRDTRSGTEHLYCKDHRPDLWPGKNPHLEVQRYRLASDGPLSQLLAADDDSAEHQSFRAEMCDLQLLGGEGACRYYLSKLTDRDQFALWTDEFLDNMREYVVQKTDGAAACFSFDLNTISFMAPLLKHAYCQARSGDTKEQTRQERAVVLLLRHPSWSDEEIAEQVPTTVKQLQRNLDYAALRSSLKRRRTT